MKILSIKGKNLASLVGEFEIDFSVEPLRSAGIFAIVGQTGAGKSTILDCLCLALYNNTPRTSHDIESSKIEDVKNKQISEKDPRNIMRRNTTDSYACVEFIALDKIKYRSTWQVKRAYNKTDGALKDVTMKLEEAVSGIVIEEGKGAVINRIENLIGLNFNQFTRTVLLAQGDFSAFLKAKQNDKAELLEKLTGTEIYSHISIKIYENHKEACKNVEVIDKQLEGLNLLSDEDIISVKEQIKQNSKGLELLSSHLEDANDRKSWFGTLQKNEGNLKEQLIQKGRIQKEIEGSKERGAYLEKVNKANEIREVFNNVQTHKLNIAQKKKEFGDINTNIAGLNGQIKVKTEELVKNKTENDDLQKRWKSFLPKLERAKLLEKEIEIKKDKAGKLEQKFKESEEALKKEVVSLNDITKAHEKTTLSLENCKAFFAGNDHLEGIVKKHEVVLSAINNIGEYSAAIDENKSLLRSELQLLESEEAKLKSGVPIEVVLLRQELIDNTPCPVCGSCTHVVTSSAVENSDKTNSLELKVLQDIKKAMEGTKTLIANRNAVILNYEKEKKTNQNLVEKEIDGRLEYKDIINLKEIINSLVKQWNENEKILNSATLNLTAETEKIKALDAQISRSKALIKESEIELLNIKNELNAQEKEKYELLNGKTTAGLEEYYHKNSEKNENTIKELSDILDKDNSELNKFKGQLIEIEKSIKYSEQIVINNGHELNIWLEANSGFDIKLIEELLNKTQKWIEGEIEYLNNIKERAISNKSAINERLHDIKRHLIESKTLNIYAEPTVAEDDINKPQFADFDAGKINENDIAQIENLLNSWQKFFGDNTEIDANNIIVINAILEQSSVLITAILNKIDFETNRFRIESASLEETNTKKKWILKAQEETLLKISGLKHEHKTLSTIREDWAKLKGLFGSADGKTFKLIAQSYTLDILLQYANLHLNNLSGRYLLERIPGSLLGLQIIDKDMLDEIRSVHTLSGGETFLVSLALALGLSSLSSNRINVESLFIDEGFGALDSETLNVAMQALENLQTMGRKIGVISHVAEMTEKIRCKIEIHKGQGGGSSIKIIDI